MRTRTSAHFGRYRLNRRTKPSPGTGLQGGGFANPSPLPRSKGWFVGTSGTTSTWMGGPGQKPPHRFGRGGPGRITPLVARPQNRTSSRFAPPACTNSYHQRLAKDPTRPKPARARKLNTSYRSVVCNGIVCPGIFYRKIGVDWSHGMGRCGPGNGLDARATPQIQRDCHNQGRVCALTQLALACPCPPAGWVSTTPCLFTDEQPVRGFPDTPHRLRDGWETGDVHRVQQGFRIRCLQPLTYRRSFAACHLEQQLIPAA